MDSEEFIIVLGLLAIAVAFFVASFMFFWPLFLYSWRWWFP